MPVMKDETGGVKKPKPAPPKKPIAPPIVKPAPKQPVKPTPAGTPAQSGQVGTAKPKPQAAPVPTAKPPLPKAAPVKPTKPEIKSAKPDLTPVSLRYEQELLNNPILKKIDRKMKEHPELFYAVVRGSASPEKAFNKIFAMWGKDDEMDAQAVVVLKRKGLLEKGGKFQASVTEEAIELTDVQQQMVDMLSNGTQSHDQIIADFLLDPVCVKDFETTS